MGWVNKNKSSRLTTKLAHNYVQPQQQAWVLLKYYMTHHNCDYRTVLDVLLGFRCSLPSWFVAIYTKHNCAELIRRLICHDYVELATTTCLHYIDAVLGVRPDDFNIKDTLLNYKYPVWIPRNEVEQLIEILEDKQLESDEYFNMYESLSEKMEEYTEKLKSVQEAIFWFFLNIYCVH